MYSKKVRKNNWSFGRMAQGSMGELALATFPLWTIAAFAIAVHALT